MWSSAIIHKNWKQKSWLRSDGSFLKPLKVMKGKNSNSMWRKKQEWLTIYHNITRYTLISDHCKSSQRVGFFLIQLWNSLAVMHLFTQKDITLWIIVIELLVDQYEIVKTKQKLKRIIEIGHLYKHRFYFCSYVTQQLDESIIAFVSLSFVKRLIWFSSSARLSWYLKMFVKMVNIFRIFTILLSVFSEYFVHCQRVNKPPYFVPGSGDMSRFSLPENTPVDSPVYQLKGN